MTGLMGLSGFAPMDDPRLAQYDHNFYLAIARDGVGAPGMASAPPFCWRILTPMIVRSLPGTLPAAFFGLSFGLTLGSSFATYFLVRRAGYSHRDGLLGELIFLSFFWAVGFNLWNYMMVDALSLLLIIAGLIVLEDGTRQLAHRQIVLSLMLTAGALNKESFVLLAVAAISYSWSHTSGTAPTRILRAIAPCIPATVATLLLRFSIRPDVTQMKEFESYDLGSVFVQMLSSRLWDIPRWSLETIVDPWGPLILVPLLHNPAGALKWARAYPHRALLVATAVAQTLFGTSVGRLVIMAAPVAVLYSIGSLQTRLGARRHTVAPMGALLGLQFLFQYLRRTVMGLGVPPYAPHPIVTAAYAVRGVALVGSALVWIVVGRRAADGRSVAG